MVAVLGAAVFGGAATPAQAQFLFARPPFGGPMLSLGTYQTVRFGGYNPIVGRTHIGWTSVGGSVFMPGSMRNAYYGGMNSYVSAGLPAAYQNPTFQQQRSALSRAQKAGAAYNGSYEARIAIADQWNYERGAKPAAALPANVDRGLLKADHEAVASGVALNELLAAVPPLESRAIRTVDSALVPPDLVAHIVFAGGPTADAVNLLRAGTLNFPTPLTDPAFDALRADLTKAFGLVNETLGHNRATVTAAADKLTTAVAKARADTAPRVRDLPFHDAATVVRFLNRLDATAGTLKDGDRAAAFVPSWSAVGATVRELTRHMARFHLTFAPAADPDAYDVLHRGLSEYYIGLARAGK
ncbi:MAG: hypothetical protein ACRC7O_11080 [Fimbriiglobus sp.]